MNTTRCQDINDFTYGWQKCQFLLKNEHCMNKDSIFDYMYINYCVLNSTTYVQQVILIFLLLLILFISLGITADEFLCPSLLVISKTLGLSQNIAGVTFLAFGNGAPDIFSSIAGSNQAKIELVIGELFGAGIFVTLVVGGSIFLTKDFTAMRRPFLRDIIFYLFACYLVWVIFWFESINFYQCFLFILLYFIYLFVVICGRVVNRHLNSRNNQTLQIIDHESKLGIINSRYFLNDEQTVNSNKNKLSDNILEEDNQSIISSIKNNNFGISNPALEPDEEFSNSKSTLNLDSNNYLINTIQNEMNSNLISIISRNSVTSISFSKSSIVDSQSCELDLANLNEFYNFRLHLLPFNLDEWKKFSKWNKIYNIFKIPIYFIFIITIPLIDYQKERQNWCRTLNSLHFVTAPFIIIYFTGLYHHLLKNYWYLVIVLAICLMSSLLLFFLTESNKPPKFHFLFGYLGFLISVQWIYVMANETVNILHCVGIMFNLSDFILGLTVLAWGNSLGDLISNVSMAKNGFARIGLSACYGGPLFNLLLGIGLPNCILLYRKGISLQIVYSPMMTLLYGTITIGLLITLLLMLTSSFNSKKFHGVILLFIYFIYIISAILIEMKII